MNAHPSIWFAPRQRPATVRQVLDVQPWLRNASCAGLRQTGSSESNLFPARRAAWSPARDALHRALFHIRAEQVRRIVRVAQIEHVVDLTRAINLFRVFEKLPSHLQ